MSIDEANISEEDRCKDIKRKSATEIKREAKLSRKEARIKALEEAIKRANEEKEAILRANSKEEIKRRNWRKFILGEQVLKKAETDEKYFKLIQRMVVDYVLELRKDKQESHALRILDIFHDFIDIPTSNEASKILEEATSSTQQAEAP